MNEIKNLRCNRGLHLSIIWCVDFLMKNKDKVPTKNLSDENVMEAYSTIQKWIKTIPSTLADIKENGSKEDLRNYQIQIKMVLNKLEEIQTDMDNGNEST